MVNITQPRWDRGAALSGWRSRALPPAIAPAAAAPSAPPSARARLNEVLGLAGAARIPGAARRLARVPRGDGHVVIDLPGWKAPEVSGAPLRVYLRALGYDARSWGLGVNTGDPERDAALLARTVVELADRHGPVSLVGWSLGGVVAREVARKHPEAVRRMVTYGTPITGGPTYTAGADAYGPYECRRISELTEERDRTDPIRVPATVMYTRRDGVVSWPACIDRASLDVEHVEVASSHIGLGVDPDVWEVVARRLALPVGRHADAATGTDAAR